MKTRFRQFALQRDRKIPENRQTKPLASRSRVSATGKDSAPESEKAEHGKRKI